jgi:hypothetical protein
MRRAGRSISLASAGISVGGDLDHCVESATVRVLANLASIGDSSLLPPSFEQRQRIRHEAARSLLEAQLEENKILAMKLPQQTHSRTLDERLTDGSQGLGRHAQFADQIRLHDERIVESKRLCDVELEFYIIQDLPRHGLLPISMLKSADVS